MYVIYVGMYVYIYDRGQLQLSFLYSITGKTKEYIFVVLVNCSGYYKKYLLEKTVYILFLLIYDTPLLSSLIHITIDTILPNICFVLHSITAPDVEQP